MSDTPTQLVPFQHIAGVVNPVPDPISPLEAIKSIVLDALISPQSRRAYGMALTDFLDWYRDDGRQGLSKATVQRYARRLQDTGLAPSTQNLRLAAVRRLALEAADNGVLAPELAAGIGRVKGPKMAGTRTGNWLNLQQAERLLNAPAPDTMKGRRDRAVLAALIGCGLRRSEVSDLTFEHIQQRDGRWAIVDMLGKGGRRRTVPCPSWFRAKVDDWATAAAIDTGRVFWSLTKGGRLARNRLQPQNILDLVNQYGQTIGVPKLAPHDLRRTFAKLAHRGKSALEQIQISLGHSSIVTTERYLGVRQDLNDAPCDHLGISISVDE